MLDAFVSQLQLALGDAYVLERELGGGGMSRLFLATERSLNRRVVVKLLPPELANETSAARFRREIDLLAHLQHPHILPVLNAGATPEVAYYVMPYVEGESLRARLTRDGRLPVTDAVRIMSEVADALGYAHRRGVVHRDIKPENILLQEGHAVLTDFGIARAIFQSTEGALTVTGLGVGTPGYMSPEQAAGERTVDARTDLYALGVVGYEMLTGKRPFAGSTATAELAAHMRDTPVAPRVVRAEIPRAVSDAVVRSLAKDPAMRFASAEAFRDTVLAAGRGAPRLTRGRVASIAAFGVLLLAGGVFYWRGNRDRATPLDADVIAIAPINVLAKDLDLWHEGLVDVLSRNLDGAGPLRTIVPSAAIKGFSGTADAASADALGRRTGAGIVLFGTLQRIRRDSVRLSATVRDVARGATRAELDRSESVDRLDQLADSISVDVMRALLPNAGGGSRLRSVGTRSLTALKEFLKGQQFFRRLQLDSAEAHYLRAIAFDSSFALAYSATAITRGFPRSGVAAGGQGGPYALRAVALNRGLGARDSMWIEAEGLVERMVSIPFLPNMQDYWPNVQRLFATTERLARLYPADVEVLYQYAEAHYHFGGIATRTTDQEVFEAFARVIRADSTFLPAYFHIPFLAYVLYGPSAWVEYSRAQERHLGGQRSPASRLREVILQRVGDDYSALGALIDTVEIPAHIGLLTEAYSPLLLANDSAALFHRALARLKRAVSEGAFSLTTAEWIETEGAVVLTEYGHLRSAAQLRQARNSPTFVAIAMLGGVPDDTARAVFREWLDTANPPRLRLEPSAGITYSLVDCLFALEWWAARRDTASIRRCAERRVRDFQADTTPGRKHLAVPITHLGEIFQTLARADTGRALKLFDIFPDSLCPTNCWNILFSRARLLAARGRDREAFDLLRTRSHVDGFLLSPFAVPLALERARLAVRLGDVETAARSYSVVAELWVHADSSLQPFVQEARRELARLGRDVPRTIGVPVKP